MTELIRCDGCNKEHKKGGDNVFTLWLPLEGEEESLVLHYCSWKCVYEGVGRQLGLISDKRQVMS